MNKLMTKQEFMKFCKRITVFNETGKEMTHEEIDAFFSKDSVISVIDGPAINIMYRRGNTGGTIYWRGIKNE